MNRIRPIGCFLEARGFGSGLSGGVRKQICRGFEGTKDALKPIRNYHNEPVKIGTTRSRKETGLTNAKPGTCSD